MRPAMGVSSLLGPVFQILRGFILALVLLLIKDSFIGKRYAWLKLWVVVAGIGIICTPAAAPASIEGMIYSQLPLVFHLKIAPELFTQTLLFSILVTSDSRIKMPQKIKIPVTITIISGISFSLFRILLGLILNADIMKSATDIGAFVVMFLSLTCIFFATQIYCKGKIKAWLYYGICYLALAVFPTIYNYMSDSLLQSPLSLIVSGIPVFFIWIYIKVTSTPID